MISACRPAFSPRAVFQYMAGQPTQRASHASRAIRGILETSGIPTKIFGSGFADEPGALPAGAIPEHSDFVLIVHDAGAPTPEDVIFLANLSAPLLLLHYRGGFNLAEADLARWKMVSVALGADQLATVELRRAGFDAALSLLLPENGPAAELRTNVPAGGPFTLLAPGDLTLESSAGVLRAFIMFRESYRRPSRLIFMGRTLDAPTAKAIQDQIKSRDLQDDVTITGVVDDDARNSLIAAANLCVLPRVGAVLPDIALYAAAASLPVLAQAVPAVAYALDEAGLPATAEAPGPDALATAFLCFAEDPGRLRALAGAQQRHLAARSPSEAAQILLNALGRCGLARPMPAAERLQISGQLGFIIAGHFEGSYSIAAVNRLLAAALEQRRPGSVKVLPVAFQQKLDILEGIPADEEVLQQALFARQRPNGAPIAVISQHFLPWRPDIPNDLPLSLFTWEETLVPAEIVDILNTGFAGVLAVSRFVAKALVDSGIRLPVAVVGQAVQAAPFQALAAERFAQLESPAPAEPFTALHVSSCFPRKGIDVLLAAWAAAFTGEDYVRLLIKTFPNPHHDMTEELERRRAMHPDLTPITLIDEDLDQDAMVELYRKADCMVLPTRGEGFNMVAAEAILAQLPLIVTGFGGHLDFVEDADVRLLDFQLCPSRSHVAGDDALWAEPDLDDLVAALREAFAAHQLKPFPAAPAIAQSKAAQFSSALWADRTAEFAARLMIDPPAKLRRIAWISSWDVRCGIAEYSSALLENRWAGAGAPEILLLCDTRSRAGIPASEPVGVTVVPAWTLGSRNIVAEIAPHLRRFDPEIMLIQHQAGLISWEDLLEIIDFMRAEPARLVVVLHSTEAILTLYHKLQAAVLFGLSLIERVIVHTLHDVENLRQLGLLENVTLLPHGASALLANGSARAVRQNPVLGCYGFFLPHKGIATLIEAFAGLLEEWPGARLCLVNAAFPSEISGAEIRACRALSRQLGADHAIDWHTGYLDEAGSRALLASCDLVVMPYDHTPESVSGAVRHALASGSPVAVSHSPIFNELNGAVHRVNADNSQHLRRDLGDLLRDAARRRATLGPATEWLGRHHWPGIARRLFNMAEALWQSQDLAAPRRLVLDPRSRLLETDIGRRAGKHFEFSSDTAGFGLYGPYLNLAAGMYKIMFRFNRIAERRGNARFEAVSQISGIILAAQERAFPEADDERTILEFALSQPLPDIEFRIYCEAGFRGVFESLSIELVAPL